MLDPIEVNYAPDGDDWTVAVTGRGQTLTAKAPGLIAARDRADQLVEKLAPDEQFRTVVHLLNGDAVEFTTAYLTARLAKSEPVPETEADDKAPAPAENNSEKPAEKPAEEAASEEPSEKPPAEPAS